MVKNTAYILEYCAYGKKFRPSTLTHKESNTLALAVFAYKGEAQRYIKWLVRNTDQPRGERPRFRIRNFRLE